MQEPTIIEAEVEEISTTKKPQSQRKTPISESSPNMEGMPDFSSMFGSGGQMPDLGAMFGNGGMPDISKLPGLTLRQRLTFKFLSLTQSKHFSFLRSKWSFPIWVILITLVLGIVLALALVFLTYRLIRGLISIYSAPFKRA